MDKSSPNIQWPVPSLDRFSSAEMEIDGAAMFEDWELSMEERERYHSDAVRMLRHGGNPSDVDRIFASGHLHVLASKLGFALYPVEGQRG